MHFISRDYLDASFQYLNLVIDIEIDSLEKYKPRLKELQFLRNKIVHNESKFSELEQVLKIVKLHKTVLSLNEKKQLKIKGSKFILDIFNLFSEFYQSLFWLIDSKQDYKILKNGFKHWLGILDLDVVIEDLKITSISISEKQVYFEAHFKNFKPSTIKFKISLTKGNTSFTYVNQTEDDLIEDFIGFENDVRGKNMFDIFNSLMVSKGYQIKVMLY